MNYLDIMALARQKGKSDSIEMSRYSVGDRVGV